MPRFLVADDSPIEMRLVTALLSKVGSAEVHTASNGREALEAARNARPDVVVSDLKMPEMDGLELLDALRGEFSDVPVVIITSKGSEEMAVEALKRGAASYLPKRWIGRDLITVVEPLLERTRTTRRAVQWRNCIESREMRLSLPNNLDLVSETVARLQEMLADGEFGDERDQIRMGVAVHEALVNAMVHGNLGISSELRERGDGSYDRLIDRRRNESPYAERRARVDIEIGRESATVSIRDEGSGFDTTSVPDPTDPENLLRASGRGILMMMSFVDEVTFNETGNAVTLKKLRPNPEADCLAESELATTS